MRPLRNGIRALLTVQVLASSLIAAAATAQVKPPIQPRPTPGTGGINPTLLPSPGIVELPHALSRTAQGKRLRTIDGSLPDVLPAGATTTLTPTRLRVGRVAMSMSDVSIVDATGASPVAAFYRPDGVVGFEFDGVAGGRFVVDLYVTEFALGSRRRVGGTYALRVVGPGSDATQRAGVEDGHLLFVVRTPAAGRYQAVITKDRSTWQFFRLDLTRVP